MNRGFTILMILAILLPTLNKARVLIDFSINRTYIEKEFCVNKEKPMVMCNGVCYLAEQLEKAEPSGPWQASQNKQLKLGLTYFFERIAFTLNPDIPFEQPALNACPIIFHPTAYTMAIFRPPDTC